MAKIIKITSPNGWPASEDRKSIGIKSFDIIENLKIACAEKVAPLFIAFCKEFNELVEPINQGQLDDWGYAFRQQRGSDRILSNHSSGTAIDVNAIKHPLGKSNTFNRDQSNIIKLLITKYGLAWGGNWKRKDEMHFEIALNQDQVEKRIIDLRL